MEAKREVNEMLNDLIRINHDRADGYEKIIQQLPGSDTDLKYLFKQFVFESEQFAGKLSSLVLENGGKLSSASTFSGKIYRMWVQVRLDMTEAERMTVLSCCEFEEEAIQRAYKQALEGPVKMPARVQNVVAGQKVALKSAFDEIKHYRGLLLAR